MEIRTHLKKIINDLCSPVDFQFQIPVNRQLGKHNFKIFINPEKKIDEYDYSNNQLEYDIEVYASSLFPVEPLSNWNVNQTNPLFRFIDPNYSGENVSYTFKIFSQNGSDKQLIASSQLEEINFSKTHIDWSPKIYLPEGHYWLFAQKFSKDTSIRTQSLWLPFHTFQATTDSSVLLKFSTQEEFQSVNFSLPI